MPVTKSCDEIMRFRNLQYFHTNFILKKGINKDASCKYPRPCPRGKELFNHHLSPSLQCVHQKLEFGSAYFAYSGMKVHLQHQLFWDAIMDLLKN